MDFSVLMEGLTVFFSIWLSMDGVISARAASSRSVYCFIIRYSCTFAPMLISSIRPPGKYEYGRRPATHSGAGTVSIIP